ncbi:Holliday junction branch migration protein RuvA [Denitrobaculum tricleocarpae]|uniref:Holliday junction branch migration complex subunit RuvA n=1 Tax=Denitrobaculum tricleocarpae TaxID=2591009 RepID=A0A545TWZ1_9PROT|nr:Holliday junction branch migration protein RuvA [Denitrobaculum tricleocarpae]TQV81738.1 Holliday junction branch migration protein RuvA [Denitrobaculum tricleocarpae]
MIGKLTGKLDSSGDDWAMIDVGGVGYVVFCSGRTLSRLPLAGETASVLIETHVREDHIHLYGFIDQGERDWYRLLSTVQGVGAKMALSILSTLGPEELLQAIAAQDKTSLTRASGVGPKIAGRIASELKEKAGGIALGNMAADLAGTNAPSAVAAAGGLSEDAISALVNLGYRRADAFGAVGKAMHELGKDAPVESLIRIGLRELSS